MNNTDTTKIVGANCIVCRKLFTPAFENDPYCSTKCYQTNSNCQKETCQATWNTGDCCFCATLDETQFEFCIECNTEMDIDDGPPDEEAPDEHHWNTQERVNEGYSY